MHNNFNEFLLLKLERVECVSGDIDGLFRFYDRPVVMRRLFPDATWEVMKGNIEKLKNLCDDKSRAKRSTIVASILVKKCRHQRRLARDTGVRLQYLGNVAKRSESDVAATTRYNKQRSDMTCIDVVKSIHASYRDPAVSRELPLMRSVKRGLVSQRVMEVSVARVFEIWKAESQNLDNVCSLSVFMKLRSDDVLLQCRHNVTQCLYSTAEAANSQPHTSNVWQETPWIQ